MNKFNFYCFYKYDVNNKIELKNKFLDKYYHIYYDRITAITKAKRI